jgi:Protein of unknown function (DUF3455)
MKHSHAHAHQTIRRILLLACVTALTGVFMLPIQPAHAHRDLVSPQVPPNLEVSAGNKLFLVGHAVGTQQYICLPSGSSFAWTLFGPQATLFKDNSKQIITHFLSSNPAENGMPRATWQHSNDTSAVWGMAIASSSDPNFVEPDAIPWLLLEVVGDQRGPTDGARLTRTAFIQRLNTTGGIAPSMGCSVSTDIGMRALVPYTADYFFYKDTQHEDDESDYFAGKPSLGKFTRKRQK